MLCFGGPIVTTYLTPGRVIAVSVVFPILGTIAVALRFYTRYSQKVTFATADWLMIPALVSVFTSPHPISTTKSGQ